MPMHQNSQRTRKFPPNRRSSARPSPIQALPSSPRSAFRRCRAALILAAWTSAISACSTPSAVKPQLPQLPAAIGPVEFPVLKKGQDARIALAECRSALGRANAALRSVDEFYAELVARYGGGL